MVSLDFSELLSLVQTVAIIAALMITVYFARRQIQAYETDLETRVLNDIDEKFHRIGEILIERPELIASIYQTSTKPGADIPFHYYLLFFCAHVFRMRERGILKDNEWTGWLAWMRNAFQYGTLRTAWEEAGMEIWVDPDFRAFVQRELMTVDPKKGPIPG
ncbi:MAG: hypothetical protein L3K08_05850 [Thermoplasmata archaeon]|nr:hypothetical protein [Thermoplasmata archaeon]